MQAYAIQMLLLSDLVGVIFLLNNCNALDGIYCMQAK
jgi:hypothetical protein